MSQATVLAIAPTSGADSALRQAVEMAIQGRHTIDMPSRNGPVRRFNRPVVTCWTNPVDRIVWSKTRDVNPFLHFIEAAWMLAGRNDVELAAYLAPNMKNYSDDGETLHGAYGFRWREWFGFDQLTAIIGELKTNRETRRCVLQMWDGHDDLGTALKGGRDLPCNTAIYFDPCGDELNMTVTCRSNDAVWGCYGANVVHMSILHEYVAAVTGFKLGTYYQMSNNLHFYLENDVTKRVMDYENADNDVLSKWDPTNAEQLGSPAFLTSYGFPAFGGETLFHDLNPDLSDEVLADALNDACSTFVGKELVGISDGETHYFNVLHAMMDGFTIYRTQGANAGAEYLESCMVHSQWILSAILWLKRRPSYKVPVTSDTSGNQPVTGA